MLRLAAITATGSQPLLPTACFQQSACSDQLSAPQPAVTTWPSWIGELHSHRHARLALRVNFRCAVTRPTTLRTCRWSVSRNESGKTWYSSRVSEVAGGPPRLT